MSFQTTLDELASWLNVHFSHSEKNVLITGVSIDSRSVRPGDVFVALRGEHFNGHDFLVQAQARGAAAVIVDQLPSEPGVPAIVVPDTRQALGMIAHQWRGRFTLPVIAVTGSNGKTTVKDMIASILAAAYGPDHMLATLGNLNNEIGVPLTLLRLEAQHKAAVIELGMNHPGEIAVLAAMTKPTVALVNNAQREHQAFMESVRAVAVENGTVISALSVGGTAVFPADDDYTGVWRDLSVNACTMVTFGFSTNADVSCTYVSEGDGGHLTVSALGVPPFDIFLPALGVHNVKNALAAIACTLAIGCDVDAMRRGFAAFTPFSGRLQRKQAQRAGCVGAVVLDDTYNANPDSVRAAIDVLAEFPAPRCFVLGDMAEVGAQGPVFHAEVGTYAKERGITMCFTLGDLAYKTSAAFGQGGQHFTEIDPLLRALDEVMTPTSTVLVKGSRFMKMERVVQYLLSPQPSA